jgi:hypothetical protein
MIPYRVAVSILVIELLSIPAAWLFGHRGNNSLLLFLLTFAVFMVLSDPFRGRIDSFLEGLSGRARRRKALIISLVSFAAVLGALHVINDRRFHFWDVDREDSFVTLFSGFLLAANALVAVCCTRCRRRKADRWKWLVVSGLFAAMALDELSEFHQWLTYDIWHAVSGRGSEALIGGVVLWITLLAPVILAIVAGLLWFIFRVLSRKARVFALAGLAFWILSQILEAKIGSLFLPYLVEAAVEETFEMVGTILFLAAFLTALSTLMVETAGELSRETALESE